jgi:hypothetical protein
MSRPLRRVRLDTGALWTQHQVALSGKCKCKCLSCNRYPFIYDPASKACLLGASNERSQWEEFQSAFLESLTTGGGMPYLLLRVSLNQTCGLWSAFSLCNELSGRN